jgi:hypothetical protein
MNWGVSAILLPKLHSSHFMGSMIPFKMRLSFIRHLIDVRGGRRFGNGERSFGFEVQPVDDDSASAEPAAYTVSTVPELDNVGENKVGMNDSNDEYKKDSMCSYEDNKDSMCVYADEEVSSKDDDNDSSEDGDSEDLGCTILFGDSDDNDKTVRAMTARTNTRLRVINIYNNK